MEEKINIAEILKNKPNGIRLYSPIFGECSFCHVRKDTNDICVKKHNGAIESFNYEGLYFALGEVMLFPSKEMRDWNKLYWKKGDVLVNEDGDAHVIFKWFDDDTHKTFNGNYYLENNVGIVSFVEHEGNFLTSDFYKENKENAQEYIHKIEEKLGGKLNSDNLEIEKTQPEFKDGDVVFVRCKRFCYIEIFNYFKDDYLYDYASLSTTLHIIDICGEYPIAKDEIIEIRIATDSEKKQLFEALAKKGKAWDAEHKMIVDVKKKWTPKPFDKVMTRVDRNAIWSANIFSHIDQNGEYVTIGCIAGYPCCIPYNEETAHLIGTTDEWKGSEG